MNSETKYCVREARRAISRGKLLTAEAYLRGLPTCAAVEGARRYLADARGEREEYASMCPEEKDAYNNL